MKKIIITVSILALLGSFAASCQKETDNVRLAGYSCSECNVTYRIDGKEYHASIHSSAEWHAFLEQMFALARQGRHISIQNTAVYSQSAASKEVVTHETPNYDDALEWAAKMINEGYTVDITFNEETGLYIVTAKK